MAASARIFHSSYRRHPPNLLLRFQGPFTTQQIRFSSFSPLSVSVSLSRSHSFSKFVHGGPSFAATNSSISGNCLDRVIFGPEEKPFSWNYGGAGRSVGDERNGIIVKDKGAEVAVVMLGWLGGKSKHLRRYVELYNAKGIHAVTYVTSVMDVLSFDLGRKLEQRIEKFANELASWLSNDCGRDRFLIFHTFSNTGWLAYGAILDNLKDRQNLLDKIKGCIVDSGGDPNIDPKVWAAGFTTALLKKSSSAAYPSSETQLGSGKNGSKIEEREQLWMESLLFFTFEKLFSYILNLPDINRKLEKIICVLWKKQPRCPQLYLYSSGDKVISFERVESFMEEQKRSGKQVLSYNFGCSPHVDHYRTFPELYASQLDNFLKECLHHDMEIVETFK